MKTELEKLGFVFSKEKRQVTMACDLRGVQKLLDNKDICPDNFWKKYILNTDRDGFAGGSSGDLFNAIQGKQDMTGFFKTREKHVGTIGHKLHTEIMKLSPKRKRKFSDFGGNFVYDRRFEPDPNVKFKTVKAGTSRTMEIDVDFTISGAMPKEEVNEYGCLVWSIADLIEKAGIQTKINLCMRLENLDTSRSMDLDLKICLKDFGQYISPSFLATCMTSNFYRRMMFLIVALCPEAYGKRPSDGLGYCVQSPYFSSKGKGHIKFGPNMAPGHMKKVESEILKAIAG